MCLPSDALSQHLPSYLGFSSLGRGVSPHGCPSWPWTHDLTCLLRNLYAGQEATVRTGHGTTHWFQIKSYPTLATPWTVAYQAPLCVDFPRKEYWSKLTFPSQDLPDPGIKPMSPSLQVVFCTAHGFFSTEPPGQPKQTWQHLFSFLMATFKHVSFDMCMTVCVFGASLVAQRLKCVLGNLYEINGPICRKKPSYKAANDFWWYLSPKSQLYLSSFSYFSSIPVIHFKIVYSFVIFSCNFIHFKNT